MIVNVCVGGEGILLKYLQGFNCKIYLFVKGTVIVMLYDPQDI